MNCINLVKTLIKDYPWMITFGYKPTSILDGDYECPKVSETLKSAYECAMNFYKIVKKEINLTFSELEHSLKENNEVTILKTIDIGIVKWINIERTTHAGLSYLIPPKNKEKVIGILRCNDNILDCEWPRDISRLDFMKKKHWKMEILFKLLILNFIIFKLLLVNVLQILKNLILFLK